MGYIDYEGNRHEDVTLQDRFLEKLYGSLTGRMIVKLLTVPVISQIGGALLSTPQSRVLINPFIKKNNIDMTLYEDTDYASYNEFFRREIKKEARPVDKDENVLVSPCDGRVSAIKIQENGVFEIKNAPYTVHSLLRDKKLAKKYEGGYCLIIRLCVTDYHRYCYVADGAKTANRRIDGVFHTVNPVASEYFPIYKENTREYTMLRTKAFGDVIQMEVGALLVGKIVNHHGKRVVRKGQEKGYFEFGGSTVIVLVQKDKIELSKDFLKNTNEGYETLIRQGESLGYKI